jgi:hypothetical protein
MRKFALLLCILVMLVAATTAASAGKPEPDSFTITGYTINNPSEEYEILPNGHVRYHILAQGGGEDADGDQFCGDLSEVPFASCEALCKVYTSEACGVSGDLNGRFTFEEWVDVNPVNGKAKNEGIVTIIGAAPEDTAVVKFKGEVDQAALTVSGKFNINKKQGAGAYDDLKGHGDYTGGAALVFAVTFTGKLKD